MTLKEVRKIKENENGTTTWAIKDEANMEIHVNRPCNETLAQVATLAEVQNIPTRLLNQVIGV